MERRTRLNAIKALILFSTIPVLIYADATGADPGLAGVPGEAGTCAACHASGTSSINTKGGSVAVSLPNGSTYSPGQVQHLVVTITDSSARRWGFQMAARLSNSTSTLAGGFKATDSNTRVICSNSSFRTIQITTTGACTTSAPLMYVEHTLAGTRLGTTGPVSFAFDWTPPATNAGNVTLYVAANAANGNNQDDTGDHVYTATYTLTPASANPPIISTNGVVNGASFASNISPGSWVTILGSNFSSVANCDAIGNPQPGCRTWQTADFANGTPTSLDDVSVTIGGKPAYIYYLSPTQINVQAPDVNAGTTDVTVINSNGASNTVSATADSFAPAFFQAGTYAIATHQDGTLVAPASVFPGASPAARGETVVLWGTGFGADSPSVPAGKTAAQALGGTVAYVAAPPSITIGGVAATVVGAALNPSALGLYQIAVTVPNGAVSGDQAIVASSGGQTSLASGVLFSVQWPL
jgi:uncharacterized protein (TIGR03437 family)